MIDENFKKQYHERNLKELLKSFNDKRSISHDIRKEIDKRKKLESDNFNNRFSLINQEVASLKSELRDSQLFLDKIESIQDEITYSKSFNDDNDEDLRHLIRNINKNLRDLKILLRG